MARSSVLARMETICVEVMEMPEIFLADDEDDEDDDAQSENLDAVDPDDEDIPAADDEKDCDEAEPKEKDDSRGKSGAKNKGGKSGDAGQDKGVSVKVNCEDKKQQRYAKWISRALRAAVNPIVSRFNLNLKVNLDLNVANKANTNEKADSKSSSSSAAPAEKPKPSPRQMQRQADLARIRELEKENRHLEKVFEKIVAGYTDMKTKLLEKTQQLNANQTKSASTETMLQQLTCERDTLKTSTEKLASTKNMMEQERNQLQSRISSLQLELETKKGELMSKGTAVKELESKLADLQESHKSTLEQERTKFNNLLNEKQVSLDSGEKVIQKLKAEFQELANSKASSEAKLQQIVQEHLKLKNQLELKCVDLMKQNQDLNVLVRREISPKENTTVQESFPNSSSSNITCPICGSPFKNLGDLQIHTENCGL
ncbi:myosin heavy chain, clone 203-like [Armigeres subalbatus]|uniref:myosin heavy chain, clone 203-like n=1 Tax=Armigeres subalbatus TaxID=124917 RepID=UPI002ED00756